MKSILQVEADPADVLRLRHAMKKAGVPNPVHVVNDGCQAIEYWKGAGKFADRGEFPLPCLVLLDLKSPATSGVDFLHWIHRQRRLPLIVIVLTASAHDRDVAMAYQLGANAFLIKPTEAGQLEKMVGAIKDFWLTHNTPAETSPESPMEGVVSLVRTTEEQLREPRPSTSGKES